LPGLTLSAKVVGAFGPAFNACIVCMNDMPPEGQSERFIEPLFGFLANPWDIYEK
jgi:hypothetical protein